MRATYQAGIALVSTASPIPRPTMISNAWAFSVAEDRCTLRFATGDANSARPAPKDPLPKPPGVVVVAVGVETLNAWEITGPSVASKPTAISAATTLSARTSPQNWRITYECDAPIALSVPISIVLSRTVIKTAKIITSVAVTIATISASLILF